MWVPILWVNIVIKTEENKAAVIWYVNINNLSTLANLKTPTLNTNKILKVSKLYPSSTSTFKVTRQNLFTQDRREPLILYRVHIIKSRKPFLYVYSYRLLTRSAGCDINQRVFSGWHPILQNDWKVDTCWYTSTNSRPVYFESLPLNITYNARRSSWRALLLL